jgi:diguanylate cyclase (GGDEF)-like protein
MRFVSRFVSLLVVVVTSLTFPSDAGTIQVGDLDGRMAIGGQVEIAESVSPDTQIEDILSGTSHVVFEPNRKDIFIGSGKTGDIWVKADLVNSSKSDLRGNAVIRFPYLQVVEAYIVDDHGVTQAGRAGAAVARDGIAIPDPFPAFEVDIPAQESRTLYVRVHSETIVVLNIWFHSSADYQFWSQWTIAIYALMLGVICTFTAYAFSVMRTSGNQAYRLYFAFCIAATLYIAFSTGIGKSFLWPNSDFSTMLLVDMLQGAVTALGGLFIAAFLDLRNRWPAFHTAMNVMVAICALSGLYTFLPDALAGMVYLTVTVLVPVITLAGVWVLHRRRVYGAGAILMAWSPCIFATVWLYARTFELTPYLALNHYVVPLGLCLTILQFSWAISNRVKDAETSAATDVLTGLPNRRHLDSTFNTTKPRTEPPCTAVLAIDLDGFKAINDTYGHEAGDTVLQVVGQRLNKLSLGRAKPYRTGGDEFIVLYADQDPRADIQAFGDECIARINRPIMFGTKALNVGASVGIAFVQTLEEFKIGIPRADAALYRAKRDGKGIVRLYDERQSPIGNETFRPALVQT